MGAPSDGRRLPRILAWAWRWNSMSDERLLRDPRSEATQLHYEVLRRERRDAQRERAAARDALRRERQRTAQALGEHKRAFDHARAEALESQPTRPRARRAAQQLMRITCGPSRFALARMVW